MVMPIIWLFMARTFGYVWRASVNIVGRSKCHVTTLPCFQVRDVNRRFRLYIFLLSISLTQMPKSAKRNWKNKIFMLIRNETTLKLFRPRTLLHMLSYCSKVQGLYDRQCCKHSNIQLIFQQITAIALQSRFTELLCNWLKDEYLS